jgi:hypothetical protein
LCLIADRFTDADDPVNVLQLQQLGDLVKADNCRCARSEGYRRGSQSSFGAVLLVQEVEGMERESIRCYSCR